MESASIQTNHGNLEDRRFLIFRYCAGIAFLLFGIWNSAAFDDTVLVNFKWIVAAIILYAIPLLAQPFPGGLMRIFALWFGVFLVAQTLMTPMIDDRNAFKTLSPNIDYAIDVVEGAVPGIVGIQRISTDEKGFRVNPRIDYDNKSGPRVFAIGASTTEDIILDDRATWPHRLQETLKQELGCSVEVINTGVSGIRAIHHLATFNEISRYEPDVALFLFGVNDWNYAIRQHFEPDDGYKLPVFQSSLLGELINETYIKLVKRTQITGDTFKEQGNFMKTQRDSLSSPDKREFYPDNVMASYASTVEKIADKCESFGGACVFLTQPHGYSPTISDEYKKSFWMTPPQRNYTLTLESMTHMANLYNRYLLDFARSKGQLVFDLAGKLQPGFGNFHDEVHFNTAGAANVARELSEYLSEEVFTKTGLCDQAQRVNPEKN